MGKITSIYLTNEEAEELERFCNENRCTQYSALKTAIQQLLSKPTKIEEIPKMKTQEESMEVIPPEDKQARERRRSELSPRTRSQLKRLLERLEKVRES